MTKDQFDEISKKLEVLTRLLALSLVAEKKQKEQIRLLRKIGLKPKEIAEIIDTTSNTVSVTLAKIKREK